ncbi:Xylulokinase, partial [Rasamsonia emersonii CBS 393.64]
MASNGGPLYIGFDLSTQQLKGLVVSSDLKVEYEAKFDFDAHSRGFNIKKGVMTNEAEHEVFAPVALWLQALDGVLSTLKAQGLDFRRVKAVSGAGQQHGSVYWSHDAERLLQSLNKDKTLEEQLEGAFSHPFSPNWQDASTQKECDEFDALLGGPEALAEATGSKAHHRFTGPQILRFQRKYPEQYKRTSRISLVSSFLASILLGRIAPLDISDVCGMNLWN